MTATPPPRSRATITDAEHAALRARIGDRDVVVSMSGGKDSAACALYLRELGIPFSLAFSDTGWEHSATYAHLEYLASKLGPIRTLRADIPILSGYEAEIAEMEAMLDPAGAALGSPRPSPMVRLCIWKGCFPGQDTRWCTSALKVETAALMFENAEDTVNVVGIRRGESLARSQAAEWEGMTEVKLRNYSGVRQPRPVKPTTWNPWTAEERAAYLQRRGSSGGIYDRCGFVGPKVRATTWDEAHAAIRASWPDASAHGSVNVWHWTSPGASGVNASPEDRDVIAEAWPGSGLARGEWWFRVLTPPQPDEDDTPGRTINLSHVEQWRPLVEWTIADVVAIHQRHGLAMNPLYRLGAERVGCWPCIYARKSDIRLIAEVDPTRIAVLAKLEAVVGARAKARRAARENRRELSPPAWFQIRDAVSLARLLAEHPAMAHDLMYGHDGARRVATGKIPFGEVHTCIPIADVVEWSKTGRGGRQVELFTPPGRDWACSKYGFCETRPGEGETVPVDTLPVAAE